LAEVTGGVAQLLVVRQQEHHHKNMKTTQPVMKESEKAIIISLLTIFFCCYVIPSSIQPLKIVGGPILFTVTFSLYPDLFRSRSGSLVPAFCLTAFVWLCAAVVGIMSFLGAVEL